MEENIKAVIKIVITGPESTGKTTLAEGLASHFNVMFVAEFARTYLDQKNGIYSKEDLPLIAKGQVELEDKWVPENPQLLICDTSLEVIRVWSEWKYGTCDPYILDNVQRRIPDLFLLLTPDIAWEPDSLRENPDEREALFTYYQKSLAEYQTKVVELKGTRYEKLQSAIDSIQDIL